MSRPMILLMTFAVLTPGAAPEAAKQQVAGSKSEQVKMLAKEFNIILPDSVPVSWMDDPMTEAPSLTGTGWRPAPGCECKSAPAAIMFSASGEAAPPGQQRGMLQWPERPDAVSRWVQKGNKIYLAMSVPQLGIVEWFATLSGNSLQGPSVWGQGDRKVLVPWRYVRDENLRQELYQLIAAQAAQPGKGPSGKQLAAALERPATGQTTQNAGQKPAPPAPGAASPQSGWQEYSYWDDGFSVSSPTKPDFQKVPQGILENHNYNINLDGGRAVLIQVTDSKQGEKFQAQGALERAKDAFVKNLNLKVAFEKEMKLQDNPGVGFEGQSEQWRARSRIYVVKGKLFFLVSMGPVSMPVAPETERIFDSLKLLATPK